MLNLTVFESEQTFNRRALIKKPQVKVETVLRAQAGPPAVIALSGCGCLTAVINGPVCLPQPSIAARHRRRSVCVRAHFGTKRSLYKTYANIEHKAVASP